MIYEELRRLARSYLRRERPEHTLQPTALVHEVYLRLVNQRSVDWQNRTHFLAIAAQLMRRLLINHARDRQAAKRDGGLVLSLDDPTRVFDVGEAVPLLPLDDALRSLEALDPRQARIVEMRFFGGLTVDETADVLQLSPATVKREWRVARAYLHQQLTPGTASR